jgi:hypothetical protein
MRVHHLKRPLPVEEKEKETAATTTTPDDVEPPAKQPRLLHSPSVDLLAYFNAQRVKK